MQYGFGAPVSGLLAAPDNLARIAVEGEAMGYDYTTISDHVVIPRDIEARYPYSDTGEFPGRSRGERHEQLTAVAFVAGKTSRLRLVTSVTVVPHRPAVLQAKDAGDDRRVVAGSTDLRHRRRLDAGGIRGAGRAALRRARRGYRRVCDGLPRAVDQGRSTLRRQIRQIRRRIVRAEAGAEAAPADLGRRRERSGVAPHGTSRRRLVPDRHQPAAPARLDEAVPDRGRAAAPADPRGWARPGAGHARLSRHELGKIACRPAPTTASGGCSPERLAMLSPISGRFAILASATSISASTAARPTRLSPTCAASARTCWRRFDYFTAEGTKRAVIASGATQSHDVVDPLGPGLPRRPRASSQ